MKKKTYLVTIMVLIILALSACSDQETIDYSTVETSQNEENLEQNNQDLPEDSLKNSESESVGENNIENSEESEKSAEVQNLQQKMEDFCQAYFNGDLEAVKGFLSESFSWDVEVYESLEDIEDIDMRDTTGLKDVSELVASEKYTLSKPFIIPGEDTMTYLTVVFVNEDGEWKVSGYGLEK